MNLIKNAKTASKSDQPKRPAHEVVYHRLREQILFGEMAPGQAVTIQGLTESLGVGMTPVREAIRRLISDGALIFQGNRRVKVPEMTTQDVEQVTYVRSQIESELARRAAQNMSASVIARLRDIDEKVDTAISSGDIEGYLRHNHEFHEVIYDVADAPIVRDLADRLWLRFGPSLRVVSGRYGTQSLPDRHKEMLHALEKGDAIGAAEAMAGDVRQGMQLVASVMSETVLAG